MDNYRKNEETEIDLIKLLRRLWTQKWIVVIATVALALIAAVYAKASSPSTYNAEFQGYVYNYQDTSTITYISSGDYSTSTSVAATYASTVTESTVVSAALEAAGLDYTYEQISSYISAEVVEDTQILNVCVTMEDADAAYAIASALELTAPSSLAGIVSGSSMTIVSTTRITSKNTPNLKKYTVIGAAAGFILSAAVLIIMDIMNNEVQDESALEAAFGISVIGSVPNYKRSKRTCIFKAVSKKEEAEQS